MVNNDDSPHRLKALHLSSRHFGACQARNYLSSIVSKTSGCHATYAGSCQPKINSIPLGTPPNRAFLHTKGPATRFLRPVDICCIRRVLLLVFDLVLIEKHPWKHRNPCKPGSKPSKTGVLERPSNRNSPGLACGWGNRSTSSASAKEM